MLGLYADNKAKGEALMGGIRRPSITKKIGKHRYALYKDEPLGRLDAEFLAAGLRYKYASVRVVRLQTGWFVYHYPQVL